jgi:hypothetical protein
MSPNMMERLSADSAEVVSTESAFDWGSVDDWEACPESEATAVTNGTRANQAIDVLTKNSLKWMSGLNWPRG